MKLNPECIRAILLTVESSDDDLIVSAGSDFSKYKYLKKYTFEEIEYHAKQCNSVGFFDEYFSDISRTTYINGLSFEGHLIVDKLRSPEAIRKLLSFIKKGENFSIQLMMSFISRL